MMGHGKARLGDKELEWKLAFPMARASLSSAARYRAVTARHPEPTRTARLPAPQ